MTKSKFTDEQVRVYGVLKQVGRIRQPSNCGKTTAEMDADRLHMNREADKPHSVCANMRKSQLTDGDREVGALNELAKMGVVERTSVDTPRSSHIDYTIKK